MPIVTSEHGTFATSETTFCPECGQLIRWEIYRMEDSEDDKFFGVLEKLIYHQENDKSCIREKKLKGLLK
jgi:hypothetical protein